MSNTFRSLCVELIAKIHFTWKHIPADVWDLIDRAHAALAQSEPVAPTDEEIEQWKFSSFLPSLSQSNQLAYPITDKDLRIIVRAVLARWGRPTPQPPADGEVAELVAWLRKDGVLLNLRPAIQCRIVRAADLLERLASDNAGLAAAADSLYADNMSLLDNHHD